MKYGRVLVFSFILFCSLQAAAQVPAKPPPLPKPSTTLPSSPVPTTSSSQPTYSPQQSSYKRVLEEYATIMNFLGSGSLFQNNADADFATAIALSTSQLLALTDYEKTWGTKDSLIRLAERIQLKEPLSDLEKWKPTDEKPAANGFYLAAEKLIRTTVAENDKPGGDELSLGKQMINQAKLVGDLSKEYLKSGKDPVLISFAKKAIDETKPLVQ